MNLNQSSILNVSGSAMFGVGGKNAYATHEFKGYIVSLEWDEQDGEPLMLMWTASAGRNAGVFGICLSSVGKYAKANGTPEDEGIIECVKALPLLGRDQRPSELNTLMDVVMQFIPALIRMPPCPRALRQQANGQAYMDITMQDQRGRNVSEVSL